MFARRQYLLLVGQIPEYRFIIKDFDFQEGDTLTITHRESRFYFKAYVSHERISRNGVEPLLGAIYTPYHTGVVIRAEKECKKEALESWDGVVAHFREWLSFLQSEFGINTPPSPVNEEYIKMVELDLLHTPIITIANLHITIQQAAAQLFADGHYRQALLEAYIAVDTAVREKSHLTGSGTRLMETAFSPGNPVLKIGDSPDEQQGFLALFRGAMLAIRNPKAHSLKGTHDAQRALEWLSFASVLLRNLDEATLANFSTTPPTP